MTHTHAQTIFNVLACLIQNSKCHWGINSSLSFENVHPPTITHWPPSSVSTVASVAATALGGGEGGRRVAGRVGA
jgi:hypothetical protein